MAQHGSPSAARGRGPHFRFQAEAALGVGGVHSTVCTHQTTELVGRVLIPKLGGGERPLGIPGIRDRVVQTAALLILQPIFEADLEPTAYGYRPGRAALEAVQEVHRALCAGHTEVIDADVSKYFDTVPHCDLMKSLARRISDRRMLRLLKMWLKAPAAERTEGGGWRFSGGKRATRGTPQGGVGSPLFANVYMNRSLKVFW